MHFLLLHHTSLLPSLASSHALSPLCRNPLEVAVDPSGTVDVVIKTILQTDKAAAAPTGSLHHHAPECYDLRLHEGKQEGRLDTTWQLRIEQGL
jgi:hypothetical protein